MTTEHFMHEFAGEIFPLFLEENTAMAGTAALYNSVSCESEHTRIIILLMLSFHNVGVSKTIPNMKTENMVSLSSCISILKTNINR